MAVVAWHAKFLYTAIPHEVALSRTSSYGPSMPLSAGAACPMPVPMCTQISASRRPRTPRSRKAAASATDEESRTQVFILMGSTCSEL